MIWVGIITAFIIGLFAGIYLTILTAKICERKKEDAELLEIYNMTKEGAVNE